MTIDFDNLIPPKAYPIHILRKFVRDHGGNANCVTQEGTLSQGAFEQLQSLPSTKPPATQTKPRPLLKLHKSSIIRKHLTDEIARQVHLLHYQGHSASDIAKKYNISTSPVYAILSGKSYKHIWREFNEYHPGDSKRTLHPNGDPI